MPDSIAYGWTGTPNASSSFRTVNGASIRTNLSTDPKLINAAKHTANLYAATTGPDLYNGHAFLRWIRQATGAGAVYLHRASRLPVTPGQLIHARVAVRSSVALTNANLRIEYNGQIDAPLPAVTAFSIPADTWSVIELTGTVPAGAIGAGTSVVIPAAPAGHNLDTSELIMEMGTTGPYFDGSFVSSIYGSAPAMGTGTIAASTALEIGGSASGAGRGVLTAAERAEFVAIVAASGIGVSSAWGSVPALFSVEFDAIGPFTVGDSPVTAWMIQIESATALDSSVTHAEVLILDPTGAVVASRPSPLVDGDTVVVTVPLGTFATPGVYRIVLRLIGNGAVTLEGIPVLVQDLPNGWHSLQSARERWTGAPDDLVLYQLLVVAREQVEAYAPDEATVTVPERYRAAQLMQARNTFNASLTNGDQQTDMGGFVMTIRPLDWAVKQLIRPLTATKAFG